MSAKIERITRNDVQEAINDNPEMKWHVIQVAANSEVAAKRNINTQLEVASIEDKVAMILVPANQVIEMKSGQKKVSNKKLYPGYIYMLADLDEHVWRAVKAAGKVSRFVSERDGKLPVPITSRDVIGVLNSLDEDNQEPTQRVAFKPDQVLRVTTGPFLDFNGVVEKVDYNKNKVMLKLTIFGRETPVEVGFDDVSTEID
jgi:transcriptional antiterminator NusG